ncbi:MAG: hypothetical protein ABI758_03550 [Candidatus Woesebacteria bacterium]
MFEREIVKRLDAITQLLQEKNFNKSKDLINQTLSILEFLPSKIHFDPIVSAYLSLIRLVINQYAESLDQTPPERNIVQFLLRESNLITQEDVPQSEFFSHIPIFFEHILTYIERESDQVQLGSSIYYPDKRIIVLRDGKVIKLPQKQNRLFQMLVEKNGYYLTYAEILETDTPLFPTENVLHATLAHLRSHIMGIVSEVTIRTEYGLGLILEIKKKK